MSDAEMLASLHNAVHRVTGFDMEPSETYFVAKFLLDDGWTHPDA